MVNQPALRFSYFLCLLSLGAAPATQPIPRAILLSEAHLPKPFTLAVPKASIALPDDWDRNPEAISVALSGDLPTDLSVRRVSRDDGWLYLEIFSPRDHLNDVAKVALGERQLGEQKFNGSLWLSLKPRIGTIKIDISAPGTKEPIHLTAPTTLVEVRGRQIFLNGEPFLMKGAAGDVKDQADADYVHSLGLNTLRGLGAVENCQRYGFMNIASLNFGQAAPKELMGASDAEFEKGVANSLDWLKENVPAAIASPNTLILQLGNERTAGGDAPGVKPLTKARRHASQLLAAARNFVKPLCPMLPVGYANQDLGFLTPDCMDVYMHNSFLDKDRYGYPWPDFLRWQGCLPPDGPGGQGRPFVNSEFGANRYLCQAYLEGPNNPFLERVHAWNFPNRWAEFMEYGTVGGCIYRLDDLDTPRDQGCSRFGILTNDRKTKLACWEVAHMWRDFEVAVESAKLAISYKRDYWARDCRLTITPRHGSAMTIHLEDFAPRSDRTLPLPSAAADGFRWQFDFTTHSGLINRANGASPIERERSDFLERLKSRDMFPFLSELFDTQVLTAEAKPAPRTLAQMANRDEITPVALRKANGVTYLLLISREKIGEEGPLRDGVTIDVAFSGKVEKVDDMTGQAISGNVDASAIDGGLRLRNVQAARIPGAIGQRSKKPFKLPIYRITPSRS